MRLDIDVAIDYQLSSAEPVLLTVEATDMAGQTVRSSSVDILNATLTRVPGEDGVGERIWANVSTDRLTMRYIASVEISRPDVVLDTLNATPLQEVPSEIYGYLRPSRFCPSDILVPYAAKTFGHLEGGDKIAAIRDWVAGRIAYIPGSSNATTCASDTFLSREGVCRDFAHLVCAFARACHIPARYTSGYGAGVNPPDFHAVAEVWLDGGWHIVDATGMSKASTLVVIASGRDASDVAFMETQGPAYPLNHSLIIQNGQS